MNTQLPTTTAASSFSWHLRYPGESEDHWQKRILENYKDLPEAFHLYRFKWQIFGHLTFKNQLAPKICHHMYFATLRQVYELNAIYFPNAQWALRKEHGSRQDLCPHFHFLIAALPKRINQREFCTQLEHVWLRQGGGRNEVRQYDRILDGATYIAKRSKDNGIVGDDCGLMFSPAALAKLKRTVKRERGI